MTREQNALSKNKLTRILFILGVSIVLLVLVLLTIFLPKKVATPEEMMNCANTLEQIFEKLDSEEISLISEDGSQTLKYSVPNKWFGKVIVSENSNGDLVTILDYQERYMLIIFVFLLGFIGFLVFKAALSIRHTIKAL